MSPYAIVLALLCSVGCGATPNGGGGSVDSGGAKDAALDSVAGDAADAGALNDAAGADVAASDAPANDAAVGDTPSNDRAKDNQANDNGQIDSENIDIANDSGAKDAGSAEIIANDSGSSDASKDTVVNDVAKVDGTGDGGSGATCSGSGNVNCAMGGISNFPAWLDTCKVDSDCVVAQHQINCCGTNVALGINACAKDKFAAAEATCEGQYPGCGCASFATLAQDGFSGFGADDIFGAKCTGGVCQSYVKTAKVDCKIGAEGFPKLFKYCQLDSECATVTHQKDCCGTEVVYGIHKAAKADYDAAEIACKIPAACDCMAQQTVADDGKAIDSGTLAAKCNGGQCSSYLK